MTIFESEMMSVAVKRIVSTVVVLLMMVPALPAPGAVTGPGEMEVSPGAGAPEGGAQARAQPSVNYAILTPQKFVSDLVPLKEWKTKKGQNAEIYTLEEMLAAYAGPDVPPFAKVHQYLRKLHAANSELRWVLVVGDGDLDGETFPVPYIMTNASRDPVMGDLSILDYVPSDVMYSGLEKDWDANRNGWYGELGEEDWTPEVYVGRWPCKSSAEVQGNVNKVLGYERSPAPGAWMRTALFAGSLYDIPNNVAADPNTWTRGYYEWPHDNGRTPVLDSAAKFPASISRTFLLDYDQVYGGNYAPASDGLDQGKFVAEFNKGYGFVTTASHAWVSGQGPTNYVGNGAEPPETEAWVNFYQFFDFMNAQSAYNGMKLPLMYSSGCDIANFTTISNPYIPDNRDKTLEQLLKNTAGGAIGFISATNGDFWSNEYGNWWLEANFWKIFFNGSFRPGEALYRDKVEYDSHVKSIGKSTTYERVRQNKAVYCLLGDPEVPVWTDVPGTLSLEISPTSLSTVPQQVTATVLNAATSQPVPNATVAFTARGTFAKGTTDAAGKVLITVDPADPGTVNVTATAHDFLPLETTAPVSLAPADLAVAPPDITVRGSGPVIKDGEQVTVAAVVKNVGRLVADDVLVKFFDGDPSSGGTEIGSVAIPSIPPRENRTAQVSWTARGGSIRLFVQVDPANTVAEYREDNNLASVTVAVTDIDLAVSSPDITFSPSVDLGGVPACANGTAVNVSAAVHNLGAGTAEGVLVRIFDGDPDLNVRIGDRRLDVIGPGGTATASVNWTPAEPGERRVFVVVDPLGWLDEADELNNRADRAVRIDQPPYFASPVDPVIIDEDRSLNAGRDLQLYAADPDTPVSSLTFRVAGVTRPEANVSVTAEGLVSVRPLPDWNGQCTATVGASDGVSEAFGSFLVTVRPVNDPPSIDPITETALEEGRYVVVNVTARDIDEADALTFTDDSPLFSINPSTGRITFTPLRSNVGPHAVKVTVTDLGGLQAFTIWRFNITRKNFPPALSLAEDFQMLAVEGKKYHLKVNATDPDGDAFLFSDDSPFFDISPSTGDINFTPPKGSAGVYFLNITAQDALGARSTRMVKLTIASAPSEDGGKQSGGNWLLPLLLVTIIAAAVAAAVMVIVRRRAASEVDSEAKARYEAIYGPGGKQAGWEDAGRKCPHCGSVRVQVFPDGGAICNKCGKVVK